MQIKLILISKEDNAQSVSDALVTLEDRLNASISEVGPTSLDQLNLVLCSIFDEAAENIRFAANLAGQKRLAGIDTFGIVVAVAERDFVQTPVNQLATRFLKSARESLTKALPADIPINVIGEALTACVT